MPSENQVRGLSVEGPSDLIEMLSRLEIDGLKTGIAVPASSSVDILDAPMNRKKFAGTLQIITLLLGSATASVKLADALETFAKDNPGVILSIKDAVTGAIIGVVDENTPRGTLDSHVKL